MSGIPVLQASGVSKEYRAPGRMLPVLTGVDLAVQEGTIAVIVGASGVGKSTLLHVLGTLDRPSGGEILYEGRNVTLLGKDDLARFRNRQIGFVFQFHHLLPEFTALENVMMPGLIGGLTPGVARDEARRALDEVGLLERDHHKPGSLSGGEQQRVAVARALVNRPKVVLADEPSGNLDRSSGGALIALLRKLAVEHGQTFVIVTHDEAMGDVADHVYRLADGRLTPVGSGARAESTGATT